jgi:5-(hydroxymethyl)furfural/furfural oxidase
LAAGDTGQRRGEELRILAKSYDYIIVGGGTAGCVLANRLSADPAVEVLLMEAGRDLVPGEEPSAILDPFPASYGDPNIAWPSLIAEVGADISDGRPVYTRQFTQGRLLGGSSSINGMMAQRGIPSDFDEWEALGAEGWGWEGVLPYFNRLENDRDFGGPLHGKDGPIPIRRLQRNEWPPFVSAVADEIEAQGYAFHPDCNGYFGDSLTIVPMNNTPERRVSATMAYLDAKTRSRPNLTIMTDTVVERLLFDNRRVIGVTAVQSNQRSRFLARETVVSAGAIHSPLLLLRSGIGPKKELAKAGIQVVADRPGVGRNLFNHPAIYLAVHLPRSSKQGRDVNAFGMAMLRYSSHHPDCPDGDMQMFPVGRTSWHPLGFRIGALSVLLYKPFSTGSVELNPDDPDGPPTIRFRLLSDKRDFERMVAGVAKAARILASARVRSVTNEAFMPPGGQANALNRPSLFNWLKSGAINLLFDVPLGFRRLLLGKAVIDLDRLASDRDACARIVRETAAGVHHVSGTCKIGRSDDPMAVVDPSCRVYGVEGLRVADASIMPTVVSANTHIPVLMIGEKLAQIIEDERVATDASGSRAA